MGGIQHPCRDRLRQGRRIGEWIDDIRDGQRTDGLKRYLRPPDEFLHALLNDRVGGHVRLSAHGTSGRHLAGQLVCDSPLDERHKRIISPEIWGNGDPEGVHERAAAWMKKAAAAAKAFGVETITGFTGSSIWYLLYSFPPVLPSQIDNGYKDFAKRFKPILDVFDQEDVYFGLEVHPTEIAFDIASAARAIQAVKGHKRFGFNMKSSGLAARRSFLWNSQG